MAISNMLGSNIFNFLILSLSDFFVKNSHIYDYSDHYSNMYLYGGLTITIMLLISIFNKKRNNIILSIVIYILNCTY